jgi:hypothetical protein
MLNHSVMKTDYLMISRCYACTIFPALCYVSRMCVREDEPMVTSAMIEAGGAVIYENSDECLAWSRHVAIIVFRAMTDAHEAVNLVDQSESQAT